MSYNIVIDDKKELMEIFKCCRNDIIKGIESSKRAAEPGLLFNNSAKPYYRQQQKKNDELEELMEVFRECQESRCCHRVMIDILHKAYITLDRLEREIFMMRVNNESWENINNNYPYSVKTLRNRFDAASDKILNYYKAAATKEIDINLYSDKYYLFLSSAKPYRERSDPMRATESNYRSHQLYWVMWLCGERSDPQRTATHWSRATGIILITLNHTGVSR